MTQRSIFTDVILNVAEEVKQVQKEAKESKAIPLDMQTATAEQMRRHLRRTPSAVKEMLAQPGGQRKLLKLMGGGKG